MVDFKKGVRKKRLEKKLTLEELGEKSGLSFMTIYYIEHDKTNPRQSTAIKIARALESELIISEENEFYFKN